MSDSLTPEQEALLKEVEQEWAPHSPIFMNRAGAQMWGLRNIVRQLQKENAATGETTGDKPPPITCVHCGRRPEVGPHGHEY